MVYTLKKLERTPYILILNVLSQHYGSKSLTLLSESTLHLLHLKITNLFNLKLDDGHIFVSSNKENEIQVEYRDLLNPSHHKGNLIQVEKNIYLEFQHPHSPITTYCNNSYDIKQLRDECYWSLIELVASGGLNLSYHSNGHTFYISLKKFRRFQNSDLEELSSFERIYLKKNGYLSSFENNESGQIFNSYLIRQYSNDINESKLLDLTQAYCKYLLEERRRYIQCINNLEPFKCLWTESIGEVCTFCPKESI